MTKKELADWQTGSHFQRGITWAQRHNADKKWAIEQATAIVVVSGGNVLKLADDLWKFISVRPLSPKKGKS